MAFSGSHDDVFCAVNNVYKSDLCAIHIFHLKQALSTTVTYRVLFLIHSPNVLYGSMFACIL